VGTMANQRLSVGYAAVHPHGRGDNRSGNAQSAEIRGSPPRAWGQLRSGKTLMACRRFTPTGVGTMVWRVGRCGASARFTPTGVGTISTSDRPRATSAVHPHGRGDNAMEYERAIVQLGSPPRAWGQSIVNAGEDRNLRFTPTGVGTIQHTAFALVLQPVHPHGRGDNSLWRGGGQWLDGSPPRAWGQSNIQRLPWFSNRFTPTGVGTMGEMPESGEYVRGSPPRAWGQWRNA